MGEWPNERRYSALHIRRACEESLKRLQTDHIDVYQFHHIWRDISWDEVWQAMERLFAEGKILYNGSANFAAWNIVQANEAAKRRNYLGLISEQSLYNLNARMVELEVLPACKSYGVGVIPWSPLGAGLLAGPSSSGGRRGTQRIVDLRKTQALKIEAYEAFCAALDASPANIALQWLLQNDAVTATIIGPRTIEQLDDAIHALDLKLEKESLEALDKIFPGPGGQAPEAYAW